MIHLGAITVNFTLKFGHVSADVLSTEMVRGTVMRPVLEIQRLGTWRISNTVADIR